MTPNITRRDFLNGGALGAGASLLAPADLAALAESIMDRSTSPSGAYPPALTGMRGSLEGSYEVAHALAWSGRKPAEYRALDEHYDLIVAGAGMSGLAGAWFYRKWLLWSNASLSRETPSGRAEPPTAGRN